MSAVTLKHNPVRPEWLALHHEEPLDPGLPVIDAHHHLYDRAPHAKYLFDEYLSDLNCGHNIRATVYVQARAMLRAAGDPAMRPVGETEFANGMAAMSASGLYGDVAMCAAIVAYADLTLGDAVQPVLEAHIAAAGGNGNPGGRLRGIRQGVAWDSDPMFMNSAYVTTEDMMAHPGFLKGFECLWKAGLSFDAWMFFHQIPRLTALAKAYPDMPIVLNHCGGILGVGRYSGQQEQVYATWAAAMSELARCPNVMVKLGGLGMQMAGFGFENDDAPPSSDRLADQWRPWVEHCAETFGTARVMFESNFPVDKGSYSYGIGLNAMKKIFRHCSEGEKADVFWRTASRFYRLPMY